MVGGLRDRVGRRGAVLLALGTLDVIVGVSLLLAGPVLAAKEDYSALGYLLPLAWWAIPWFAIGALCLGQAFVLHDEMAYGGAIAIKLLWSFGFLFACAWTAAAAWLAICAMVLIVSGWPEVPTG